MPSGECSQPKCDMDGYKRLTLEEFTPDGADRLVKAIVVKAVQDYTIGLRSELKHPKRGASLMRVQAERFFISNWFNMLTGLNGKIIVRKLKKEVTAEWIKEQEQKKANQQKRFSRLQRWGTKNCSYLYTYSNSLSFRKRQDFHHRRILFQPFL